MLRYLSMNIIFPRSEQFFKSVHCTCSLTSKTVHFEDKYLGIMFTPNESFCVYYPSNIFPVCGFENWGISNWKSYSPDLAGEYVQVKIFQLMDYNVWYTGLLIGCDKNGKLCEIFRADYAIRKANCAINNVNCAIFFRAILSLFFTVSG